MGGFVKVNTVGGDGFTSPWFSLSDTTAPLDVRIGFVSFGLIGIVLKAPPNLKILICMNFMWIILDESFFYEGISYKHILNEKN